MTYRISQLALVVSLVVSLLSAAVSESYAANGLQDELKVFEINREVTTADRGFPRWDPIPAEVNGDWTKNPNFKDGTFYYRVEVFSQPSPQQMRLQFCIWQDQFVLENCGYQQNTPGNPGTVRTWSQKVTALWKKEGNLIDWSRPRQRYGIAIKNSQGIPISNYNGWNWNGEDPNKWYPLNMRFTVVVVAAGGEFDGWDNYIGSQPQPTATPAPQPTQPPGGSGGDPTFSVQAIQGVNGRVGVGDFDKDGKQDIVVMEWAPSRGTKSGQRAQLKWYKNPGWSSSVIATDYYFGDSVEVADIDRDGDQDVVTTVTDGTSTDKQRVMLYLNNGTGSSWKTVPLGAGIISFQKEVKEMHLADMDGDGKLDIAARFTKQLRIYYQNGAESWVEKVATIPNAANGGKAAAEGMGITDVDRDGKLDAVLEGFWIKNPGNRGTNWTRSGHPNREQDTDGSEIDNYWNSSSEPNTYKGHSVKVAIGDLDGDNIDDIVISDSEESNRNVYWYKRVGKGWSETLVKQAAPGTIHSLQIADFNLDGKQDILIASKPEITSNHTVFLNTGNGSSFKEVSIPNSGSAYSAKVADINSDGKPDIISPNGWDKSETGSMPGVQADGGPRVKIITNTTNGGSTAQCSLTSWSRYKLGTYSDQGSYRGLFAQPGDFDGDGKLDIAAGKFWYKNSGSITNNWQRNSIGGSMGNIALVYDFNRDGKPDILGTELSSGTQSHVNNNIVLATNTGGGNFSLRRVAQLEGDFLQGATVGQVNGKTIVFLSWHGGGNGVHYLEVPGNVNSTWPKGKVSSTELKEDLSLGDIDKDGDTDLLLGTIWLENNGSLSNWTPRTIGSVTSSEYPNAEPDRNDLVDIDRDGRLDAVVALENGKPVYWFRNTGSKTNWERKQIGISDGEGFSMDSVDFDRDGDIDVVVGEHKGSSQNKVWMFENNNNGSSWTKHQIDTGSTGEIDHHDGTQAVDLDGDGDYDIVSLGWNNKHVWAYKNTASCTSNPVPTPTAQPTIKPTTATIPGDFDGNQCVNVIDFGMFISVFNTSPGDTGYDKRFNLDSRPEINAFDFSVFISNFQKGC